MTRSLVLALLLSVPASAAPGGDENRLRAATVTLARGHCAGVVLHGGREVLTAAHCLDPRQDRIRVDLNDGRTVRARVDLVDWDRDLALLALSRRAPAGLELAPALPGVGDVVLFAGRVDWPMPMQVALVEDLRPCPSLPTVPAAIFTTIEGRPGDSGAPVVDGDLRVVGLVHGGADCEIVTPVADWPPQES